MLLLAPLLLPLLQEPVTVPVTDTAPISRAKDAAARGANAVSMSFAGLERLFVDPRDQGLLDFLLDTVDRLPECAELGGWGDELPVDQIQLVTRMLMSPWDLAIDHNPNAMPFPVSGHWHFHADSVDALREDETLILEFLRNVGIEIGEVEENRDGLRPVLADEALGGFDVRMGAKADAGKSSFVLSVNEGETDPTANLVPFLPSSVQHAFSMRMEAAALMEMLDFTCSSPMVPPVLRGMCDLASKLEVLYSVGHGEEVSQSTMRLRNFIPLLRDLELLDEQPLAIEDLSLIPNNATGAAMLQVNPKGFLVLFQRIAEAAGEEDPLQQLLDEEEVDLEKIIDSLGSTFGYYNVRQESEGQADFIDMLGMRTTVLFAEVKNEDGIREAIKLLEESIADKDPNEDPFAIRPLFRFESGFLFVSFDEPTADRASAQARDRANSLLSRPELLEALGRGELELMMMQWQDTPKLAGFGYDTMREFAEMASGFMDQMAIDMQVDRIFPAREVMLEGARPKITTVRREIDDLAAYTVGDRSMILNLCAMGGQSGFLQTLMMLGSTAGAAGPAPDWELEEEDEELFEEEEAEER